MSIIRAIPRRSVNLPPGSLRTLISCIFRGMVQEGPALENFREAFRKWLGTSYVFGASSGRSAFQLALEALGLEKGKEIIFPVFTFPVIPMVAKMLGYKPVFCEVDPLTFNAGLEHIEPKITENTGAILATHLFGQPCPIGDIMTLARTHNIRVMEDCAHACGVRVGGQHVGTFGDIGIFSFAEGKNMPCFGGGAIATTDEDIARRAGDLLSRAPVQSNNAAIKLAFSVWVKWFLTQPLIFGLTAYQALRIKLLLGKSLMDSAIGNDLIETFAKSTPQVSPMSNLQAAIGLLQLRHIEAFNEGARRNAQILTENMGNVPGIVAPRTIEGDHIYVYYPLTVKPERRDDLRHFLLRHGIDTKITDMSDCSALKPFRDDGRFSPQGEREGPSEATILEICVYPIIPEKQIREISKVIQTWKG